MEYVEHLIDKRVCKFWPISDWQQVLSAAEIEEAGATIKHWRNCRQHDDAAIASTNAELAALKERKCAAMRKLFEIGQFLTVCVVHDSEHETNKTDMLTDFEESFAVLKEAGITQGISVGYFQIWTVLVAAGDDVFMSRTCDTYDLSQKPSVAIPETIARGGSLEFLGTAKTPDIALKRLKVDGFFG